VLLPLRRLIVTGENRSAPWLIGSMSPDSLSPPVPKPRAARPHPSRANTRIHPRSSKLVDYSPDLQSPSATRPSHCATRSTLAQRVHGSHGGSNARTARSLVCASRPTVAQSVQCSHRALIDLRSAFIVLRSAFKARTERSTLAQRVQRPHSAFMGLRNAFIARTEGSKVAHEGSR
jgi:hypothetical protein